MSVFRKSMAAIAGLALVASAATPVAANPAFTVTVSPVSKTADDLVRVIVGNTAFTDAKLNGLTTGATFDSAITTTGTFSGGESLVGVDSGLILTADAKPDRLSSVENISNTFPRLNSADSSLPGALFSVAQAALNANSMESISTLEFKIQPSSQFLKLTYSLVITENGSYSSGSDTWSGAVYSFPDGVGIFVKQAGTAWAANQNCAVIPTTSSYLAMGTAGIVPQTGTVAERRAAAQANYDTLVAPTLVAGYVPPSTLPTVAANPGASQIAPPRIAYSTNRELGIEETFLTVPLTCVVDVSGFTGLAEIGIVVANFNDNAVPPAILIAGDSVGFAGNQAAVPVTAPQTPQVVEATPYVGPNSSQKIYGRPAANVALKGTLLSTVSKMTIAGVEVAFTRKSDGSLAFVIPSGLKPGTFDVVLTSDYGTLTLQEHLVVLRTASFAIGKPSTKKTARDSVKVYYFNPEGKGKVQFFVEGKEIAWHKSLGTSSLGAKLTNGTSSNYLVRTVKLSPTKTKAVEIYLDGKRVWRASYKLN